MVLVHKIYEFSKLFHFQLKSFPKQEKFSLGSLIEKTNLEILEKTILAAYSPKNEKIDLLRLASNKNDLLKYLIRLAHDFRCFNTKQYFLLEEEISEIGRMLGGWLKNSK